MLQEFVDNVESVCRDIVNEIHTALPGKVNDIDTITGMATVTPIGAYRKPDGEMIPYPVITDVPVIIPGCAASGIQIAFPIKTGDSVLIIVSEQELDAWLYGEESECELRFDLTNAICIPGLSQMPGKAFVEACRMNSVIIQNGNTKLTVSSSKITVHGNIQVEGSISATGSISHG